MEPLTLAPAPARFATAVAVVGVAGTLAVDFMATAAPVDTVGLDLTGDSP